MTRDLVGREVRVKQGVPYGAGRHGVVLCKIRPQYDPGERAGYVVAYDKGGGGWFYPEELEEERHD